MFHYMFHYILYIACKIQHTMHCMQNVASVIITLKKNVNECSHGAIPEKIQMGSCGHGIARVSKK